MQYERGGDAVLSRRLGMKMADFGLSKSIQDGETILTVYIYPYTHVSLKIVRKHIYLKYKLHLTICV